MTQATTLKVWVWVLRHTTPLTHINFFETVCAVGGCLMRAPMSPPPLIMLSVSSLPAESFLFLFLFLFACLALKSNPKGFWNDATHKEILLNNHAF